MSKITSLSPRPDWALFLDVDGTIIDLAESPNAIIVPEGLSAALKRASEALGGALALVSGRPVEDLDAMFHPLVLPAAGVHGLELRIGRDGPLSKLLPPLADRCREKLAATAVGFPGVLVENKEGSVALHYRRTPQCADELLRRIEVALEDEECAGLTVRPGKMVWEVRRIGIDKGDAVDAFMEQPPFAGRIPVFVGDDDTDADGFAAAQRLGGIAVPVGTTVPDGPSFAVPADVRLWLASLPDRLAGAAA
jgi:trehalose 6-phosphate phosphatase